MHLFSVHAGHSPEPPSLRAMLDRYPVTTSLWGTAQPDPGTVLDGDESGTTPLHPERLAEIGWNGSHTMLVDLGPLDDHFYMRVTADW